MLELGPTIYIQIINFLVLLVLLKFLLWKPFMEALDARQSRIAAQVKEAEAINEEARNLKGRYEAQMAQAKDEAQKMIRDAVASAEKTREQIVAEAREESSRILRQTEREVQSEKEKAMSEVKRHMADLTVAAAAKVLQDSLDKPTQEKLMVEFVRRVGDRHVN